MKGGIERKLWGKKGEGEQSGQKTSRKTLVITFWERRDGVDKKRFNCWKKTNQGNGCSASVIDSSEIVKIKPKNSMMPPSKQRLLQLFKHQTHCGRHLFSMGWICFQTYVCTVDEKT
jgi:hypothetical protein